MKETYRILPVYAGDVSGIAGALYELGGMTVIHDPSGCNSTYNTHDELRWYHESSNIFISGLNMRDAVLGNDSKFIRDILQALEALPEKPGFIALCNSPVPWLNGTDFGAIARMLEKKTGIPSFYVPSNGCHDYARGAGLAWEALLRKFIGMKPHKPVQEGKGGEKASPHRTVNVLGMMPLDFAGAESCSALESLLQKKGLQVQTDLACGAHCSLELLPEMAEADVSLVLSKAGLLPAIYLQKTFGIPYVTGVPFAGEEDPVIRKLQGTDTKAPDGSSISDEGEQKDGQAPVVCLTEPVLGVSLASLVRRRTGRNTIVIDPLEADKNSFIPGTDASLFGEEEIAHFFGALPGAVLLCDPAYAHILPEDDRFRRIYLPTLALSGRIYRKHFVNYFQEGLADRLISMIQADA
ncbi:MAG: nitrogenase component 1 [Eubacterium sp.]|nr:nitrogenase component 1 [Eubacterium sp.]